MASTAMTSGDQGISQLEVELNAEVLGVEAALPQVADVALQFTEGHLLRLQRFLLEILRLLADLRIAFDIELAETADRFAIEAALPSMFKDPLLQLRLPIRAGGEDAAGKREILRVEFEHG